MRLEEARYIGNIVRCNVKVDDVVLNLGSSTLHQRKYEQPHIQKYIFEEISKKAINIVHADLKDGDGIDMVGNIFCDEYVEELKSLGPNIILATNLIEHLPSHKRLPFARIVKRILMPKGILIVSVPYSYPLHPDPIDSYYRPSPEDLAKLFDGLNTIKMEIILGGCYAEDLKKVSPLNLFLIAMRMLIPFYKPMSWIGYWHRLYWLHKQYKVSIIVLKKTIP